jgi:hypothetical protein
VTVWLLVIVVVPAVFRQRNWKPALSEPALLVF